MERSGNGGVAALRHLTGPARGRTLWLDAPEAELVVGRDRRPRLSPPGAPAGADETAAARLRRTPEGVEIEAAGDAPLWIDGRPVRAAHLRSGGIVEFGERGPISRVALFDDDRRERRMISELAGDAAAYLRASRRPLPSRAAHAAGDFLEALATRTTWLFRGTVTLALIAAAALLWQQQRSIARLEREAQRLDAVSAALSRAAEEAVTAADLAAAREAGAARLAAQAERLARLEAAGEIPARVIAEASPAVAFVQGAYGFREPDEGRWLRHAVDAEGRPLASPFGRPLLTPEGEGPIAEREFTGTGVFLRPLAGEGPALFVTNRHVALPWERDATGAPQGEFEPRMTRLLVWRPGRAAPHAARLAAASEASDLALLTLTPPAGIAGLALAEAAPAAGAEVITLGYPTGLRALLAQAPPETLERLREAGAGFWAVAEALAAAGAVRPLASRGIVARSGPAALLFDAETTRGASGGAVLDRAGRVVAIQSAIMPDFAGANLAVPAAAVRALLAEAPQRPAR